MPAFTRGDFVLAKPDDPYVRLLVVLGIVLDKPPGGSRHIFVEANPQVKVLPVKCLRSHSVVLGKGASFGPLQEQVDQMLQEPLLELQRDGERRHYLLCQVLEDGTGDAVRLEDNQLVQLTKQEVAQLQQQTDPDKKRGR